MFRFLFILTQTVVLTGIRFFQIGFFEQFFATRSDLRG
jgi:hypothetical protein